MGRKPKDRKALRTLGIDPGMREMGYAVVDDNELVYFGVHTFKRRRPPKALMTEGERVVGELIDSCKPSRVVIGEASAARWKRSPRLRLLIGTMKRHARRRGAPVTSYPLTQVKEIIAGDRTATKQKLIDEVVTAYPFLAKHRESDVMSGEKYWENMFEAVALALTGYHQGARRRR
jgi:Holliday junction resolvasome RuvABC endonuclease subunit